MRFTIRTLLVVTAMISVSLGSVSTYHCIWQAHCRRLTPSLYASVLQDTINYQVDTAPPEFEHEGITYNSDPPKITIYFALGRTENGDRWISPSQELVRDIGLPSVLPASEMGDDDVVHHIENVRWIDWNTVILDYGMSVGALFGGGVDEVILRYENGEWQVTGSNGFSCAF